MLCMLRILGVIFALFIAVVKGVRGPLGSCRLTPRGAAARGAAMPDAALELLRFLRSARLRLACLCYISLPLLRAHQLRTSRSCKATATRLAIQVVLPWCSWRAPRCPPRTRSLHGRPAPRRWPRPSWQAAGATVSAAWVPVSAGCLLASWPLDLPGPGRPAR